MKFEKFFHLKPLHALGIFIVLNTLCVGLGMGVPIFNILFGFVVGWYIVRMVTTATEDIREILSKILLYAIVTSIVTFVEMALIWGLCIPMLFDPNANLATFGIPQILYTPKPSFIGWLVLMIVISPFLQLLTTMFGAQVMLLYRLKNSMRSG